MSDAELRIIPVRDESEQRWLHYLNNKIFPTDVPPIVESASWWLAWDRSNDFSPRAVAFGGCKAVETPDEIAGFHYRAGVMPSHRGWALQRRLLVVREEEMKRLGLATALTYTENTSAASMRSLIGAGYRPYSATKDNGMCSHERWGKMVYWKKSLI